MTLVHIGGQIVPFANGRGASDGVRKGLTSADLAKRTDLSPKEIRRLFARWIDQGWPLVWREATASGFRYVVDAAEYEAVSRGEITETAAA